MPIYEFRCNKCDNIIEQLLDTFEEAYNFDGSICECGGQLIRMYSSPFLGKPKHRTYLVADDGSIIKGKFEK
jgi:putative FmdB family regulatory protein